MVSCANIHVAHCNHEQRINIGVSADWHLAADSTSEMLAAGSATAAVAAAVAAVAVGSTTADASACLARMACTSKQ